MVKTKKNFFSLSLGAKVSLFIIIITILPFCLVVIFILNSLSSVSFNVEKKALDQTSFLIEQDLANSVSAKAQIYDLTFKNMAIDLESIKNRVVEEGFKESYLTEYYYKHQLVSAIYFIDSSGSFFIAPDNPSFVQKKVDISEISALKYLTAKDKNEYLGRWLGPYTDFKSSQKIVSYVLPVWKNNKLAGITAFDIKVEDLFNNIVNIDPSRSSYLFIIKDNGEFIPSSEQIFSDFSIARTSSNLLESPILKKYVSTDILSSIGEKSGSFTIQVSASNEKKVVAFSIIPSFGGKVVTVSPLSEIVQIQEEKASEIQQTVNKVGIKGFFYMLILTFFIVVASIFLSRKGILNPIDKLKQGVESLEKTGFNSRINVTTADEIGDLTESFNNMAGGLSESRVRLEEYSRSLEKLVEERTKELEESKEDLISKIEDLEKFNKVAVDRELKMIELKTKINDLEEKLKR
jgi:HAMP domain-containing protein